VLVNPREPSAFLNLTVSLVDLPWFSSNTVTVVEPFVILNGFKVKTLATAGSVLSGLAFNKPCASAECDFGSNCGCFFSNSDLK